MPNLGQPSFQDVAEAIRAADAVADDDDVRIRVRQWTEIQTLLATV